MALFGGSAPFLATYLIEVTSDIAAPAYMLIVASLLCLCGLPLFAERYKESVIEIVCCSIPSQQNWGKL